MCVCMGERERVRRKSKTHTQRALPFHTDRHTVSLSNYRNPQLSPESSDCAESDCASQHSLQKECPHAMTNTGCDNRPLQSPHKSDGGGGSVNRTSHISLFLSFQTHTERQRETVCVCVCRANEREIRGRERERKREREEEREEERERKRERQMAHLPLCSIHSQ